MSYRLVMFKQTIAPKLVRLHKLEPSGETWHLVAEWRVQSERPWNVTKWNLRIFYPSFPPGTHHSKRIGAKLKLPVLFIKLFSIGRHMAATCDQLSESTRNNPVSNFESDRLSSESALLSNLRHMPYVLFDRIWTLKHFPYATSQMLPDLEDSSLGLLLGASFFTVTVAPLRTSTLKFFLTMRSSWTTEVSALRGI